MNLCLVWIFLRSLICVSAVAIVGKNEKFDSWFTHNFKRYFISSSEAKFSTAVNYCKNNYNGSLIEINDAAENIALNKIVGTLTNSTGGASSLYWIGLVDQNGTFTNATWIDSNTTVGSWNTWHQGIVVNSSKLCAGVSYGAHAIQLNWTNLRCCDHYRFICQLDLTSNNSQSELSSYPLSGYHLPTQASVNSCNPPSMRYNKTCITAIHDPLPFSLCKDYCEAVGKRLIQIESKEKLQAIKSAIPAAIYSEMWIGLRSLKTTVTGIADFQWLNSSLPPFTNWEKFRPLKEQDPQSGKCVTMSSKTFLWNNRRCTSFYPFLCEQELTCPVGWWQLGEKCYQPSSSNFKQWSTAFYHCQESHARLAILHDESEFNFVASMVRSTGKSVWIALKSNTSGLQWINDILFDTHRNLNTLDLCMVANITSNVVYWQLQNCLNNYNFYPLCEKDTDYSMIIPSMVSTLIILILLQEIFRQELEDIIFVSSPCRGLIKELNFKELKLNEIDEWYLLLITATCPYGWLVYNKRCYDFHTGLVPNSEVSKECSLGSQPVIINDANTDAIINAMISNGEEVWIGLQYVNGFFFWYGSNLGLNYSVWAKNQPSLGGKDCVSLLKLNRTDASWYTRDCNRSFSFICQRYASGLTTDIIIDSSIYRRAHSKCPTFWNNNGSSCIRTTYLPMSFYEARELCGYHSSDLLILSSKKLQDFVENLILLETQNMSESIDLDGASFWLGLYKTNQTFRWLQDSSILHPVTKLGINSSNNHHQCAAMKYVSFQKSWVWYPVDCIGHKAYPICRKILTSKGASTTIQPAVATTTKSTLASTSTPNSIIQDDNYDQIVDDSGLKLAEGLNSTNSNTVQATKYNKTLDVHYFVMSGIRINFKKDIDVDVEDRLATVQFKGPEYPQKIEIPPSVVPTDFSGRFHMAVGVYKTTPNQYKSSSSIPLKFAISCSIKPMVEGRLSNPVVIYFRIEQDSNVKALCVYWKRTVHNWASDDLFTERINSTVVKCISYHLTSFSVLLQYSNNTIPAVHKRILSILTYIGLSISLMCLLFTFITFTAIRRFHSIRGMVHANLAVSMIISTCIFLFGIEKTHNEGLCQAIAFMLHFSFLASFSWMLVEGIVTFKMSYFWPEKISSAILYLVVGWGTPLVTVLAAFLSNQGLYGTADYCWIKPGNFLLLAFGIPVMIIIAINLILMARITKTLIGIRAVANKSSLQKVKVSLRAAVALLPLLGVTWAFGFISANNSTVTFSYLFVIFNSLQVKKYYMNCFAKGRNVISSMKNSDTGGLGAASKATRTIAFITSVSEIKKVTINYILLKLRKSAWSNDINSKSNKK
ncbi:Adhesion G protein-coupled receptor L3 [Trichoplax sp. H2]|nr:Adhesion G protein-coupled receptor L3 [Trichoplax sp. H2]|eukprot:RDD37619.1 Adhesion G protein-coupled receptor L3 [Trichoplax sp. H2]